MKIDLKGVHYDVTEVTRNFALQKLDKIKYAEDHIVDLHLTLSKEPKEMWKAETHVNLRWGTKVHLDETTHNLHESIERLIDRLDQRISKEKDKIKDHHHPDTKRQGEA